MKWLCSIYVFLMSSMVFASNPMLWGQKNYNEKPKADWTLSVDFILLAITIFLWYRYIKHFDAQKKYNEYGFFIPFTAMMIMIYWRDIVLFFIKLGQ